MRLPLTIALVLLFLWLHRARTSMDFLHGDSCQAASVSEAALSLLVSPLCLYSWLVSTLLRLVLSVPALVLGSVRGTVLLLLAGPWCLACAAISALLACLHVALYLLHLALLVASVAILTLARYKMAGGATSDGNILRRWRELERRHNHRRRTISVPAITQHQ